MGLRILIVDDSPWMRRTLVSFLETEGWTSVFQAKNGREGVTLYEEIQPDIVLMDITMPYLDGLDAVRAIIKIDPRALIVMCSALGQREMVIDCIRSGAKGFVVKPFRKEHVIAAIRKALPADFIYPVPPPPGSVIEAPELAADPEATSVAEANS